MYNAGSNATLTVSSKFLSLVTLETNEEIAKHDMPRISFASGGDSVMIVTVDEMGADFLNFIVSVTGHLGLCGLCSKE